MPPLSSSLAFAYPSSLVVIVRDFHFSAMGLHSSWKYHGIRCYVVAGAEGLLLSNGWQGLRDHSFASDYADSSANSFPNTATHTSTDAACDAASAAATHSATAAAPSSRTRGSLQLRSRPVFLLGWGQAAVVLQDSPHLWAAHSTASAGRSIQLRGWFRELAGWLECRQEGVVLSGAWQRLPEPGRWLRRRRRRRTK